jgi:sec-independent protein translocase protein TatB
MFDLTSSKLLILAIVALLVVGPKDLPLLLRTVGKYLGVIRRHANEFRAQFDEAIREAELHELKKEFESMQREVNSAVLEGERAIDAEAKSAKSGIDDAMKDAPAKADDGASATATTEAARTEIATGKTKSGAAAPETQLPEKTGT